MLDHLPVKKKPTLNIIPPQLRLKIIIIIEVIKINKTHFAVRVSTPPKLLFNYDGKNNIIWHDPLIPTII
jgi:hypothetical protein